MGPHKRCGRMTSFLIRPPNDEKFLFKHQLEPEQTHEFALRNTRDIIAVGFRLEKMTTFRDHDLIGGEFYKNVRSPSARRRRRLVVLLSPTACLRLFFFPP